jgi:hypothetical protein
VGVREEHVLFVEDDLFRIEAGRSNLTEVVIAMPWKRNDFVVSRWMDKRLTWFDALCALAYGLLIWRNGGALVAACIVAVVGYLLLRFLVVPMVQWNVYRNFEDQPIFNFSDQGVTFVIGGKSRSDSWAAFKSAAETRNFYTLKRGFNAPRFTIAKRMLANENDEARLRELLRTNTKVHLRPNKSLDSAIPDR